MAHGPIGIGDSIGRNAAASAVATAEPLHKACDRCAPLHAEAGPFLSGQKAHVTAMHALHLDDKFDRLLTAGIGCLRVAAIRTATETSSAGSCPRAASVAM